MYKKLILIFSLGLFAISTSAISGPVVGPSPVKKSVKPGPSKSVKRAVTPGPSPVKKAATPRPAKRAVRR